MTLSSKKPKCAICRKEYSPDCDFNQGRCPHHPPTIKPMSLNERLKFLRDIKFFDKFK